MLSKLLMNSIFIFIQITREVATRSHEAIDRLEVMLIRYH